MGGWGDGGIVVGGGDSDSEGWWDSERCQVRHQARCQTSDTDTGQAMLDYLPTRGGFIATTARGCKWTTITATGRMTMDE